MRKERKDEGEKVKDEERGTGDKQRRGTSSDQAPLAGSTLGTEELQEQRWDVTFRSWDDSLVFICLRHRGGGAEGGEEQTREEGRRGAALADLAQINSSGNPLIRTSTDPTEGNHSVEGGDAALGRYGRQTRRRRQRR